jgi:hypothetical protein
MSKSNKSKNLGRLQGRPNSAKTAMERAKNEVPGFAEHIEKFEHQITIKSYAASTVFSYSRAIALVSLYFKKSPLDLEPDEINSYLYQLSKDTDLSEQGKLARVILLDDLKVLTAYGASPILNVIKYYDRDDTYPFFPTDVYSFHVDRSPIPTATFLCTYEGEPSEILPNWQGKQKVLIPEIPDELKKLFGEEPKVLNPF